MQHLLTRNNDVRETGLKVFMAVFFFFLAFESSAVFAGRLEVGLEVGHSQSTRHHGKDTAHSVQLGPRPFFLVQDMDESKLKEKLSSCANGPFKKTDFSIGHRGAGLQFPEHTRESYEAAVRMGAGIVECDVTFTKDRALVCRHSQCDLHATTNILATPLAEKCTVPFSPAEYDENGNLIKPASAQCCTSDITVAEFKTLTGKMDAVNAKATTIEGYMMATPDWRTDLYSSKGTVMTHKESIELFKKLEVKMTPELKSASVAMPFDGDYTQEVYAQQMINEYIESGVSAKQVFAQSFNVNDVRFWIKENPEFGKRSVYLDGRYDDPLFDHRDSATWSPTMEELAADGVKIIAPPMWMLVEVDYRGKLVASDYAKAAKSAGLDIITWTLERSGLLKNGGGWYYQTSTSIVNNDGDVYEMLDVLAKDVGVIGVFSDWSATVSYYANCMNLN